MKTVYLIPGHGGDPDSDRGFDGTGREEHEGINNWLTSKLMQEYLESKYIVTVYNSRPKVDDYPTIAEACAMHKDVDLVYSFHSNASLDKTVRGTEMWIATGNAVTSQMAVELAAETAKLFGHRNRGVKDGKDYKVIRHAKANGAKMAIMAENGFHSNPTDADILVGKRVQIAELQAEIIAKHLKLEVKPVEKRELDTAEKWAVDNGIMRNEKWNEPATRSQMAWWLFDLVKKWKKGELK